MNVKVTLDKQAVGELLKTRFGKLVDQAAERIASQVRSDPAVIALSATITEGSAQAEELVQVDAYTTDRQAAAVVLAHPAGLAVEAKHGVLTRAAKDAGLQVAVRDPRRKR
ncbi:conserved hypothetical protein [Segniliparus rotundus DSM 44985]|uniref:Uncharacterized protein n=1 Tax=Segniliparus rotundus (strain ATCC BAA-972 / CDC 1076 / CIP 108378 / DSM 44985 / JCM 13578) TaxID=640132 RepID=D6ZFA7_SEGRD|nr:hypothetical protein [Segniliparus rotundus]ADG97631.1 conserved hypothetical protein [Segniliparus rotundus DSM 44985]